VYSSEPSCSLTRTTDLGASTKSLSKHVEAFTVTGVIGLTAENHVN
jgi:hypothetical protein